MAASPYTLTLRYDVEADTFDEAREIGKQLAAKIDQQATTIGDGIAVRHKLADFRVKRQEALRP